MILINTDILLLYGEVDPYGLVSDDCVDGLAIDFLLKVLKGTLIKLFDAYNGSNDRTKFKPLSVVQNLHFVYERIRLSA